MTEGRPPHAVLLRAYERFDPRVVAAALSKRGTLPAESFMPVVRRSWGVVGENSAAADAEALAAALTAAGAPAVAVPQSLIEDPAPVMTVTKAELSGDGLDIESGKERARLLWSHLKVLSGGAVAEKAFIDAVFAEPARRVRIPAEGFDYAALGDKMTYSAELNFRALTAALAARAPGCLRSRGARAILAKAPSGESSYESFEDAEREERWLLALAVLGAAQA